MTRAYQAFAPSVRRSLKGFGIEPSDVPDLCQEVFALMHVKSPLGLIANLGGWLQAVSRKLASGHRRKAHRRRDMLFKHPSDLIATMAVLPSWSTVEERDDETTLRWALDSLDGEARKLLALHDEDGMPLARLAELLGRDRKTVRKRLDAARRDVALYLQRDRRSPRKHKPSTDKASAP